MNLHIKHRLHIIYVYVNVGLNVMLCNAYGDNHS